MMNVIEVQDALKGMPMEQLIREVQMPSGQVPQFLVLSEITRRREMEKAYAQNQGQPQTTVAQDAVTGAGVPQEGIAGISRAMAPNTDMAQNTGAMPQAPVQQMASGGYVQKMQRGGIADLERAQRNVERSTSARVGTRTSNPRIMQIANMFGITVEDAQRMIENYPELLDVLAPPSAMATAPGISAKPLRRTLAQVYQSRPRAFRSGVDVPAVPGPIPLPVGGSTTAEKPDIPSASYRTGDIYTALPAEMEREMARAQMAEDVRGGRAGASTLDAFIEGENRRRAAADDRFLFPDPTALPAEMEREIARAQMAEDVRGGRAGANTVGASQEAERRRRAAAFLFDVQGMQPDVFTDVGSAFMPSPGAAPAVMRAPTMPQLAALTPPAIAAAPQDVPRALTGAQNLPLAAGLGDTTRGQEAAAAMFDVTEAERRRREEEALAAAARREMLPFTSAFDPVVSTYTGEEGQYPRDPLYIHPEAPLPQPLTTEGSNIALPEGGIEALLLPRDSVPIPPPRPSVTPSGAPTAPPAKRAPPAGLVGAMSPFESEIANLLQQREKRAEQDKWLALAQTGLALMGSRQPTFAGALGEAGAAGLKQFQEGRAQYDKDRLELLALQESTRLNRAKLAAAAQGKGLTPYQAATLARQMRSDAAGELTALIELRKGLEDPMGNPPTDERLGQWEALTAQINSLMGELYGVGGGDTGGEDFATSAARAS